MSSAVRALKRLVPKSLVRRYHHALALLANMVYGRPSRRMVVIGVTGTDGKTTTSSMIADVLRATGAKVGLSTSAIFQIGSRRWMNESHLTMPGRFQLQKLMQQMVQAGCEYAVIEVSSEGLAQFRHAHIDFDIAVMTNLSPEHIEAHGSFEAYRDAKGKLFNSIIRGGDKHIHGRTIKKTTVVNLDDPSYQFFLKFWAEQHYGTTLLGKEHKGEKMTVVAGRDVHSDHRASHFTVDGKPYSLPMPGEYNVRNALQAVAVGQALDVPNDSIAQGLAHLQSIPGRAEEIETGKPWRVIVDYALTPAALEALYQTLRQSGAKGIIGVFGAAGGGRDTWKRPALGKIANQYCRRIILTTDDPYSENPEYIAAAIAAGIVNHEKVETILDRRDAIRHAMSIAQAGDVIAITGMGSETSMMVNGKQVPWSDVGIVKEVLHLSHGQ